MSYKTLVVQQPQRSRFPKTLTVRVLAALTLAMLAALLLPVFALFGTTALPASHAAPFGSGLKVQYRTGDSDPGNGHVVPHFLIVNEGGGGQTPTIPLSELTLRYWFSARGDRSSQYQFWCDYARVECSNVTSRFVAMPQDRAAANADHYLELGFTDRAGMLASGGDSGQIITRFNQPDWSPLDERNDYSFDPARHSYQDTDRVTLYHHGQLVWGKEPGRGPTQPNPTTQPPSTTTPPVPTTQPPTMPPPTTSPPVPTTTPALPTPTPALPTPTLPPPDASNEFVQRQGNKLWLDGKPFRMVGANMVWLGLDEFNDRAERQISYPTHFRIDDGMATARSMGTTVVRSHTLAGSTGCELCLMPQLGEFNQNAFEPIDYAIASARKHGLKLIIPLTDQWHYYHGGKHDFTNWLGYPDLPGANPANDQEQKQREAHFYTEPRVIEAFESYITYLLNHTNQYTGLKYKDDPTIMAWETGNEIWDATDPWTQRIARHLKSLAPRHLVSDGSAATGMRVTTSRASIPAVDIVGGHFHPIDLDWLRTDARTAAAAGKVYYVGEYDWQGTKGGQPLADFLTEVERNPDISGDVYWELRPRADRGGYIEHEAQYDLHYPGNNLALRAKAELLRAHAYRLRGLAVPPVRY